MALIRTHLGIEATMVEGRTGQFEVVVDGVSIVQSGGNRLTRILGAGYPDPHEVVQLLALR